MGSQSAITPTFQTQLDNALYALGQTAIPQPPTNVAATDGTYTDKVRVTWTAPVNANAYEVWRNTSNNSGSATKISSSDVAGTSYDDTTATAGTTYWYWVKAKNANGTSGFSAVDSGYRATVSGPVNDNFANRDEHQRHVGHGDRHERGRAKESGEPNHAGNSGGKSVWWTWTAPSSGSVQIDTIGSNFDTILGVYTGSSVSSLTTVASDDDSGGNYTSKVTFNAVGGTTYQIAVDGYNYGSGMSGSIILHVSLTRRHPGAERQHDLVNVADDPGHGRATTELHGQWQRAGQR